MTHSTIKWEQDYILVFSGNYLRKLRLFRNFHSFYNSSKVPNHSTYYIQRARKTISGRGKHCERNTIEVDIYKLDTFTQVIRGN